MTDIFLSYSRDDAEMREVLCENLRKLGINIWVDVERLKPGTLQWSRAIKEAVRKVDVLLVLCSPTSEKSEWVNREVYIAKAAGKPVVPVLIKGSELDSIPADIVGAQYCDLREHADHQRSFRELVEWLETTFNFKAPQYEFDPGPGDDMPVIQVTDEREHEEGRVTAIRIPTPIWLIVVLAALTVGLLCLIGAVFVLRPLLAGKAGTATRILGLPTSQVTRPTAAENVAVQPLEPTVPLASSTPSFTPLPAVSHPVITAQNANQLQMLDLINAEPWVSGIALSPDSDTLAVTTSYRIEIYSLASPSTPQYELVSSQSDMDTVDFNFDGSMLASAGQGFDNAIQLWDMKSGGTELSLITGHTDSINDIAFSPDGTKLASGSYDKSVRIWDVATGEELFYSLDHADDVTQVDFSPDGSLLASGGADGVVRLWDVATGQLSHGLETGDYDYWVSALAFDPDGSLLASASEYHTEVRLWDARTGEPVLVLRGHEKGDSGRGVFSVAFNPAGTLLASGGEDMTIRLWDINPDSSTYGQQLAVLQRHPSLIAHLLFSPDGTRLISAGGWGDGTIIIWTVSG